MSAGKNGMKWLYNKDTDQATAKKMMEEWIRYDWMHWVFIKTAFVPEDSYTRKQDEILRYFAQFADLRRSDISFEDTFMHVTDAYECDDCEDMYELEAFKGYREADLALRANWGGVDEAFASGFTRARGYLTIAQSIYRPALVSVYRKFAAEDGAPVPQDTYRIRVLDSEKSRHCGDIENLRNNGGQTAIKKVNSDISGSISRLVPKK